MIGRRTKRRCQIGPGPILHAEQEHQHDWIVTMKRVDGCAHAVLLPESPLAPRVPAETITPDQPVAEGFLDRLPQFLKPWD
jgi:hypothetical protein